MTIGYDSIGVPLSDYPPELPEGFRRFNKGTWLGFAGAERIGNNPPIIYEHDNEGEEFSYALILSGIELYKGKVSVLVSITIYDNSGTEEGKEFRLASFSTEKDALDFAKEFALAPPALIASLFRAIH